VSGSLTGQNVPKHRAITDHSNSALYWAAQIFGGLAIPLICDLPPFSTRSRAIVAWTALFIFGNTTMLLGSSFESARRTHSGAWIEFGGEGYQSGATLYFAYGMLDALWQGVSHLFPRDCRGLTLVFTWGYICEP